MAALTVNQARRSLGKDAQEVSDDLLELEIEFATMLKDIFFEQMKGKPKPIAKASQ